MTAAWMRTATLIVLAGSLVSCAGTESVTDPVAQLVISPRSLALMPDDSAALTATAMSVAGGPITARIRWTSSDTNAVRVSARGEVRAVRQGTATITASSGVRTATAVVSARFPALTGVREYAHRGFGALYPENTLVAADSAFARGADGIEADVQLTSDSVPVIIHDATVDRTTNGTGTVASLSLAQIRTLDACSKKGPQWAPCRVPLAEEMIQKVRGRGLLILDLKGRWSPSQLAKLFSMVRRYGMLDATMVTSFEMSYLRPVRQVDARIAIGWLQGIPHDPTPVLNLGNAAVIVEESAIRRNAATMGAFDSVLAHNGSILGAFTLQSSTPIPELKALGVRWFIADRPLNKTQLHP